MFRKKIASSRPTTRRNKLSRQLRVEAMEPRLLMSAEAFELIGLNRLRQEFSFLDGSGVDDSRPMAVVVIDGKVDDTHTHLDDQVIYNKDFLGGKVGENQALADSHGTHVAGIVAAADGEFGVATGAKIVAMNVFKDGVSGAYLIDIMNALEETRKLVDDFNIVAVNMSLGGGFYTSAPNDPRSSIIRELESLGVTVVASAGNSYAGPDSTGGFTQNSGSPGIVSTINVGAVWEDGNPANNYSEGFSYNRDPSEPDIVYRSADSRTFGDAITNFSQRPPSHLTNTLFAPGGGIESSLPGDRVGPMDGTSMASPMVAGAVAIVQHAAEYFGGTRLTPNEIASLLRDTGVEVQDGDDEKSYAFRYNERTGARLEDVDFVHTNNTYKRLDIYAAVMAVKNRFAARPNADTNNTLQTATPISLPTPDSFNTVPSTFVPTRQDRALLPTGKAAPIVGHIGNDGENFVGSTDVDLYRFQLDMDARLKFTEVRGLSGNILRLFNEQGASISLSSQREANLSTGTYYVGVSTSSNNSYDPVNGSGASSGGTQGDYSIQIDLTPVDVNGTIDTATRVSVSVAEGTFTTNADGFFTKAIDAGVSTWVEASLGKDKIFGGTEYSIPNDIDVYRVTAPADGKMMIDVDGKIKVEVYQTRSANPDSNGEWKIQPINSADFQLHVFRNNGGSWGRIDLGNGESNALATNIFGDFTEDRIEENSRRYFKNKEGQHGAPYVYTRPKKNDAKYGGRDTDPFVSFDASAGDEFAIVVYHKENQNYTPHSLSGRSAVVGNGGKAPYDYDIFFNFSSEDVDQTMSTAQVPSNGGVLSINGNTVGGQVTLGEDKFGTRTLKPGSDDVDLIKVNASEKGVIDFSLQSFGTASGNTPTHTVLRAFDENGNPLHSVESSTTGFNEIKVAVDGPKVIYIGVSGAGNDSYGISRSVAQTEDSSLPTGRKSSFDYSVRLLASTSNQSGSNNNQPIEVKAGSLVPSSLGFDNTLMFAKVADDIDRFTFTAEKNSPVALSAIPGLESYVGAVFRVLNSRNEEVASNASQQSPDLSQVKFLATKGEKYTIEVTARTEFDRGEYTLDVNDQLSFIDINGDGKSDRLDGALIARTLFNLPDRMLEDPIYYPVKPARTAGEVKAYVESVKKFLDINNDGTVSREDGALIARSLFNLNSDLLTDPLYIKGGNRKEAQEIRNYVNSLKAVQSGSGEGEHTDFTNRNLPVEDNKRIVQASAIDAVMIIDYIESFDEDLDFIAEFDVNEDGKVTALDVLFVINRLNRHSNSSELINFIPQSDFDDDRLDLKDISN